MPNLTVNANLNISLPKYAKLPKPIFHCQTPLKNARFELFGILKCQLATLLTTYRVAQIK